MKSVGISINERYDLNMSDRLRPYFIDEDKHDDVAIITINGPSLHIRAKGVVDSKIRVDGGGAGFVESEVNDDGIITDFVYSCSDEGEPVDPIKCDLAGYAVIIRCSLNAYDKIIVCDDALHLNKVFIYNLDKLSELDLSGNDIADIKFTKNSSIEKLILNDNNLKQLDVSKLQNLRYLHCIDNPLSYDLNEFTKTVNSLPNRSGKPLGSIVFYPYMGLEILLWEDGTKFPTGEPIAEYKDQAIYGFVQSTKGKFFNRNKTTTRERINTPIIYKRRYNDYQTFGDIDKLNVGNDIRRAVEFKEDGRGLLQKNWVVGSGIQYHEDWSLCYWPFRKLNVADFWETAGKGFGLTYATVDSFSNKRLPLWEDFNGYGLFSMFNSEEQPLTVYEGRAQDYHGDALHQYIAGRAQRIPDKYNLNMGLAPNITSYFFSYASMSDGSRSDLRTIKFITEHCDLYSSSYSGYNSWPSTAFSETNSTPEWIINYQKYRKYLGEWSKNNFSCVSAGNSGDDNQTTLDDTQKRGKNIRNGDFTKRSIEEIDNLICGASGIFYDCSKHSNTYSVNSMMQNDLSDPYSTTAAMSLWEDEQHYSDYTDAYSMYGCQTPQYYAVNDCWYSATGTSNASPALAAVMGLMRIVFSKMYPDYPETAQYDNEGNYIEGGFGKGTTFADYVNENWINKLPDLMTYQVGLGLPNIMSEPSDDIAFATNIIGFAEDDGDLPPWNALDLINLNGRVILDNPNAKLKRGYTLDFCHQTFAEMESDTDSNYPGRCLTIISNEKLRDNLIARSNRPEVSRPYVKFASNSPLDTKSAIQYTQCGRVYDLANMGEYIGDFNISSVAGHKIPIINQTEYIGIPNAEYAELKGLNLDSKAWTIQIPYSVELLFSDVLKNHATLDRYSTLFPQVQFKDNDSECGMVFATHRLKIDWDSTNKKYWIGQSTRPYALQPKAFQKFVTGANGIVDYSKSVYTTYTNTNMSGHNLEFHETVVITYVADPDNYKIDIYYNGTYMSTFYLFEDVNKWFTLRDAQFITPNIIGQPLIFDKALNQNAIIYNTAYLKQFKSNLEY